MAEHWTLTLRRGPKVTKERYGSLDEALDGLQRAVAAAAGERRAAARALVREIEPVAQVAVRAEIAGPQRLLASVRGGVDVRGDGSPEAFVGRLSRQVVQRRADESAVDALRRTLAERTAG